ncbi:MAG: hypothetical protein U0Z26_16955 [Anaerolineales bacterium]
MSFRIYIDENLILDETVNAAQNKPVIDLAHIPVPNLEEGNHTVRIEVDFLKTNTEDWAAWAVIKLWK